MEVGCQFFNRCPWLCDASLSDHLRDSDERHLPDRLITHDLCNKIQLLDALYLDHFTVQDRDVEVLPDGT